MSPTTALGMSNSIQLFFMILLPLCKLKKYCLPYSVQDGLRPIAPHFLCSIELLCFSWTCTYVLHYILQCLSYLCFCPCSWPYFRIYSSWCRRLFRQNTQLYTVLTFNFQMVGLWQLIVMFTWPFLCTFLSLVHVTWQYLSMISGGYPRCLFHHVFQWSNSQMLSNAARNSWFFSLIQEFGNLFVTALVQTLALHECIKYTF